MENTGQSHQSVQSLHAVFADADEDQGSGGRRQRSVGMGMGQTEPQL